jgi:uncharacterized RDD family membrane protein YckC
MSSGHGHHHHSPSRASVGHLRPDQVELLCTVLRVGDVHAELVDDEIIVAPSHAKELSAALAWVNMEQHLVDETADDPEYQSDRSPLVKPSRPPLADGRRQATRWRRFAAGMIDELLVGVPTALALKAGSAPWTLVVLHLAYYAVPTAMFGWSPAKLWCGLRVVDHHTLRRPRVARVMVRTAVAAVPRVIGLYFADAGSLSAVLWFVLLAPILVDLRGVHDRAAGTLVVERSVAGPRASTLALAQHASG